MMDRVEAIMDKQEGSTKDACSIQIVNLKHPGFLPEHLPRARMCTTIVDLDPLGIQG